MTKMFLDDSDRVSEDHRDHFEGHSIFEQFLRKRVTESMTGGGPSQLSPFHQLRAQVQRWTMPEVLEGCGGA
jgi:hypothetical protein